MEFVQCKENIRCTLPTTAARSKDTLAVYYKFLLLHFRMLNLTKTQQWLSHYYLQVALLHGTILKYRPSVATSAIVLLVAQHVQFTTSRSSRLKYLCRSFENSNLISDICELILDELQQDIIIGNKKALLSLKSKFGTDHYDRVSTTYQQPRIEYIYGG